jgi:CheY-like chemotaxis protein
MTSDTEKKLVLVVDDEPDENSYLTTLLEDNGYKTASASNGNKAMDILKQTKPDLITLDMSMPEKSGVKLFREIRENPDLSAIPVLVVTGVTGHGGKSEDFEKFLSTRKNMAPPEGFIPKPIDQEALLKKIAELLG